MVPADAAGTRSGAAAANACSAVSTKRWLVSTFPPATGAGDPGATDGERDDTETTGEGDSNDERGEGGPDPTPSATASLRAAP